MPVEVVLAAGLYIGLTLDRERARTVRRELRSREALAQASRLLARRELSVRGLSDELERRRVAPAARRETVSRLREVGAVDDARAASRRAEVLAGRGAGDFLIRADLESRGFAAEVVAQAIEALTQEDERARRIVTVRGASPGTARYLARRGFGEDAIESALGGSIAHGG